MSKTTIPRGGITADAIDGTLIADDAINSEHYTDGSIDTAHIGDNQVTAAKATGVGGLTLISRTALANANATAITGCFSSTYADYLMMITNCQVETDGASVDFRFGTSGTADTGTYYAYAFQGYTMENSEKRNYPTVNVNAGRLFYSLDNGSTSGGSGVFYIQNPNGGNQLKAITGSYCGSNSDSNTELTTYNMGAWYYASAAPNFTDITIFSTSGNLRAGSTSNNNGVVAIYGITKS